MPRRFYRKRRKEARRTFHGGGRAALRGRRQKRHGDRRVLLHRGRGPKKYGEYLRPVLRAAERAYCIAEHVAPLLSDTKHPQGIFCVCRMPDRAAGAAQEAPARVLVLENVQDPSNMGTILRTAEALGVLHIALVGACCDLYSPKVLRGSMGAVFRLGVERYEAAPACAEALGRRRAHVAGGCAGRAGRAHHGDPV